MDIDNLILSNMDKLPFMPISETNKVVSENNE